MKLWLKPGGIKWLTPSEAIAYLRKAGYPLPERYEAARTHLVRLTARGLLFVTRSAGGHRRFHEIWLDSFLKQWRRGDVPMYKRRNK